MLVVSGRPGAARVKRSRRVEEIAGEYDGKLKVTKLNVDDHPATASRYGIRGIPNLIILKGGAVKEQIVGAVPKAKLVAAIDKALE